jgi:hypothetical protein
MQTIKGLSFLLVVAALVFAIFSRNDMKSQKHYASQMGNPGAAYAATAGSHNTAKTPTNAVIQTRHKVKKSNL